MVRTERKILYKGIDISYCQHYVDFEKVRAAGYQFAMIRCGRGAVSAQKPAAEDTRFRAHAEKATAAGFPFGVWFYSYAHSPAEARAEAKKCLEIIRGYRFSYPVALDWEEKYQLKMPPERQGEIIRAFLSEIEAAGYYAVLYASKDTLQNVLRQSDISRYDHWVAQVGLDGSAAVRCGYTRSHYGLWQYSWKGRIDGVTGANGAPVDVDLDCCYYDYPKLTAKLSGHNTAAERLYTVTAIKTGLTAGAAAALCNELGRKGFVMTRTEEGK